MSTPRSIRVTCISAPAMLYSCVREEICPSGLPTVMPVCAEASVELSLEDTRIFVPQDFSEKHQYFLSCLDLCQQTGMPGS